MGAVLKTKLKKQSRKPGKTLRELTLETAKQLQEKHGNFNELGVTKTLEREHGKKIDREQVGEIIRTEPGIDFHERVGTEKLYKFRD